MLDSEAKSYSIDNFWVPLLGRSDPLHLKKRGGWYSGGGRLQTFVEADLNLAAEGEYGHVDPEESKVILISAPGAVGKSTLAREIVATTNAILVNLAETGTVGANFVAGGLTHTGAYADYAAGRVALIIDGLDEARFRVSSGDSFADFLKDVADLAMPDRKPIVLLGRTGSIQETWLLLAQQDVRVPVLEIGYLTDEKARRLSWLTLRQKREEEFSEKKGPDPATTESADAEAINLLFDRMRDATSADGGNFAGYAPVLRALALQVLQYKNPSELVARIKNQQASFTLESIVDSILEREQRKLDPLELSDTRLKSRLYTRDEQIDRLIARVYGFEYSGKMPEMSPSDRQKYDEALERWAPEHPFLDGGGTKLSTEVFAGYLAREALRRPERADRVRRMLRNEAAKINPFVASFYLPRDWEAEDERTLFDSLADIPVIFSSFAAGISQDERVLLAIREIEDEREGVGSSVEVEITWEAPSADVPRRQSFVTSQLEPLAFGARIDGVEIIGPSLEVEIGTGSEVVLRAPVFIDVGSIILNAQKLTVEPSPRAIRAGASDGDAVGDETTVVLRAEQFAGYLQSPPDIRDLRARLSVYWPGCQAYPWNGCASEPPESLPEEIDEAFRRLIKMLLPFKSDKYGELGKFKGFVDHARRTKGSGKRVRDQLLEECILTHGKYVYILDPDRLLQNSGLTRQMMRERRWGPQTIEFLRRALARNV